MTVPQDIPNDHKANSETLKFKAKMTWKTPTGGNTENVETVVPMKHLRNFWRTLEIHLLNCKLNLQLTCSANCVITSSTRVETFAITNTRLYVLVVTLSTEGNTKLLQQLNSEFKRTINWNKYLTKNPNLDPDWNLSCLVSPSYQGVNRLYVLSFEDETGRRWHGEYCIPTIEIKDYNVKINVRNVFDQL